ncbi:Eco57I restriction-modification methylase domain-containing protein [Romeria aff. gracilis LEGE 07310]|uniref:site-specific DNA-methyltransferase (adenine-specific) n=2 Tax=Vasconcelosia TaxID=3366328 RepID=A0A8J7DN55_9CYAN|nr:Eco57I restriction-modification methylase domain-containing protein [Romeria aff. gracilis LEGE 07310]
MTLAKSILEHSIPLLDCGEKIRFLDPAFGTGVFYSALLNATGSDSILSAQGFEVDPCYGEAAKELWKETLLNLKILDFTKLSPPKRQSDCFNLIICNPPYVRHHHIESEEKINLRYLSSKACESKISGLAGLYCHFLCLSHPWMQRGGVAAWLIPSEFMDVNYGKAIKQYLLQKVTLIQIHRFDYEDTKFDDALVSSAVVWIRNSLPPPNHKVLFTFGESMHSPNMSRLVNLPCLKDEPKWTRFPSLGIREKAENHCLSDLFEIKRGIATGDNKFFILTKEKTEHYSLPDEFLRPILPSPRYILANEIQADQEGLPILEHQLFLLDCRIPEEVIRAKYPSLWKYLKSGKGTTSERYLCRTRKTWYFQEKRLPAPIICTYLGRKKGGNERAFRFILNSSKAVAPNVYLLLYPRDTLKYYLSRDPNQIRRIWEILNALEPTSILEEGRVYGGGLHKIEPKELGNVNATRIVNAIPSYAKISKETQHSLFE